MRPKMLFPIGPESWGFVARGLANMALERCQGLWPRLAPGVVSAGLCGVLQQNILTDRLQRDEAQTARAGFILGCRALLRWHSLRQPCCLLRLIGHCGFLNMPN